MVEAAGTMSRVRCSLMLGAIISIGSGVLGCWRPSDVVIPPSRPASSGGGRGALPGFLMGTASCAGRSCHGSLDPLDRSDSWQMEYTVWDTRDPHARAYQVLLEPAAKEMARRLGLPGGKAHEAPSCLVCHTTWISVAGSVPDAESVRRERSFGVGCEACHGSAVRWIDAHVTKEWKTKSPERKWDD